MFGQFVKKSSSNIQEVNVYQNRALINRIAKLNIDAGTTDVILTGLSTKIDANSIQVNGKGSFVLMGVNHKIDYLQKNESSEQAKKLQEQIDALVLANKKLENKKRVLVEEKELLLQNRAIGGQQNGVSALELQKIATYFRIQRNEIEELYTQYDQEVLKNNKLYNDLNNQLSQINRNANQPSSSIVVSVSSKTAQSITLNFDYMVYEAGWIPYYDVRAKEDNDKVQLNYKAQIYQNTGIDWENVMVNVSTGNPAQGGNKPNLNPWYLSIYVPYTNQDKKSNAPMYAPQRAAKSSDNGGMYDEVAETMDMDNLSNYTTVSESNLATTFKIALKQNIPSDNQKHTVDIQQFDINASFTHAAVPKLDKDAFLLAQLSGWEEYNLLSGEANVFYDGSFVGKTFVDMQNTTDSLDVSLGRDSKVIISREKIKDYCKTKTIGSNVRKTIGYEIVVRNTKKQEINLILEDQLPISKNSEIVVEMLETSSGVINENTKKISWNLKLNPGETKKIVLKFEVKYPKDKAVSGL